MSSGCAATTRARCQSSGIGEVGMAAVCPRRRPAGGRWRADPSPDRARSAPGGACMRRLVVLLVALALLCGCDGTPHSVAASDAPSTSPAHEAPLLQGQMLQFRRDAE